MAKRTKRYEWFQAVGGPVHGVAIRYYGLPAPYVICAVSVRSGVTVEHEYCLWPEAGVALYVGPAGR